MVNTSLVSGFISITLLLITLIIMVRNNAVSRFRLKILDISSKEEQENIQQGRGFEGHKLFESLPSYDTMLIKFWVWPLTKFLPEDRRNVLSGKNFAKVITYVDGKNEKTKKPKILTRYDILKQAKKSRDSFLRRGLNKLRRTNDT